MNGRKLAGIVCILLGIALCAGLIASQYNHCVDMWKNTHKGQEYASALVYFFAVSKGAVWIAIILGATLLIEGGSLLKRASAFRILLILLGILLLLFGIAVGAMGIGFHIAYLRERYQSFAENGYFDSFRDYYWAVGKGNLAASILIGAVPAGIGVYFLHKKQIPTPSSACPLRGCYYRRGN